MLIKEIMFSYLSYVVLFVSVLAKNEEYIGYKVYNIKLTNQKQQDNMYMLKSDIIDYWRKPCLKYNVLGRVMVPPSHAEWFEERLTEIEVDKDVYIDDVYLYLNQKEQQSVRSNRREEYTTEGSEDIEDIVFDFDSFHRYDEILAHLNALQEIYANSTTTLELNVYGQTEENRPLVYLKLTNGDESGKPVAIIEAAINPRDWVTVSSALSVVSRLLEDDNRHFLDDNVWIVVPVLNPDGYEYTHTNLRLWTKSRSLRSSLGIICPGVNLNRNFNIDWLVSDSSSSPCSHLYAGTGPASEIETQMIKYLIEEYSPKLYISLQNSGKLVTYPWSFEKAASGLFRRHYFKGLDIINELDGYSVDSGAIAIGDRESGTSVDFARQSKVLYAFNIGVDGEGDNGVIVPEEDILTVAEDVWRAVAAAARDLEIN